MKRKLIIITLAVVILGACEEDYHDKEKRLFELVSDSSMGSTDYWLELKGDWTGEWYKVALVFGFGSGDGTACQEIADDQNSRLDGWAPKYRCVAAN